MKRKPAKRPEVPRKPSRPERHDGRDWTDYPGDSTERKPNGRIDP